jgi:hypothetical protein
MLTISLPACLPACLPVGRCMQSELGGRFVLQRQGGRQVRSCASGRSIFFVAGGSKRQGAKKQFVSSGKVDKIVGGGLRMPLY